MCRFALSPSVTLRKEWFGGIAYISIPPGIYHQFNHDAYKVFRELVVPRDIPTIVCEIKKSGFDVEEVEVGEFIARAKFMGIVIPRNGSDQPESRIYFDDKLSFRQDCLVAPTSVTIYITEKCTKLCKHCVVRSSPRVDTAGELSAEDWKVVLNKLRSSGVCSVVITGGEPLLKPGILEIISHADDIGLGISLLTDYDYINRDVIAFLESRQHLVDIQTSIDGSTPGVHDYLRGQGSFKAALHRLSLLRDCKIDYTISFTAHRGNVNEIDGVVEIAKQYGARYIYINPLAPYGRAKNDDIAELILGEQELKWLARKYVQIIRDSGVDSGNPFWQQASELTHSDDFDPFHNTLTAVSLGTYNMSLDSHGECYLDSKMKSEGIMRIGNIVTDSVEDIWYNPIIDRLRRYYSPDSFSFVVQSVID